MGIEALKLLADPEFQKKLRNNADKILGDKKFWEEQEKMIKERHERSLLEKKMLTMDYKKFTKPFDM